MKKQPDTKVIGGMKCLNRDLAAKYKSWRREGRYKESGRSWSWATKQIPNVKMEPSIFKDYYGKPKTSY